MYTFVGFPKISASISMSSKRSSLKKRKSLMEYLKETYIIVATKYDRLHQTVNEISFI